jgi:hypothetical protein
MRDLIKIGCVAFVLSVGLAAPVAAGPFEDGITAHNRGDYATALRLWRPLADRGHPSAQVLLGGMYALGQGVPQDYTETVRWYRKAADQGDARAQSFLGVMYANGHGVRQDNVQAHKWCNLAAARFSASEREDREKAVINRDRVAAKMTAAQIAEAQRLAREWRPK